MREIDSILSDNKTRYQKLFVNCYPMFGINSEIERFPFKVYSAQERPINIPFCMIETGLIRDVVDSGADSLEQFCKDNRKPFAKEKLKFTHYRLVSLRPYTCK